MSYGGIGGRGMGMTSQSGSCGGPRFGGGMPSPYGGGWGMGGWQQPSPMPFYGGQGLLGGGGGQTPISQQQPGGMTQPQPMAPATAPQSAVMPAQPTPIAPAPQAGGQLAAHVMPPQPLAPPQQPIAPPPQSPAGGLGAHVMPPMPGFGMGGELGAHVMPVMGRRGFF